MRKTILFMSFIIGALMTLSVSANTLSGVIKDAEGNAMKGVLVRVTDAQSIVSESVYTNGKCHSDRTSQARFCHGTHD